MSFQRLSSRCARKSSGSTGARALMRQAGNVMTRARRAVASVSVGVLMGPLAVAAPTETVLHVFTGTEGYVPKSGLQMNAAGELFGSNLEGVGGSVFKLSPPSPGQIDWAWQVVYAWSGNGPGARWSGALSVDTGGNLFGPASGGLDGAGAVFALNAPVDGASPWTQTILYSFAGRSTGDGDTPSGALLPAGDGGWYGTTAYGGASNSGMVYKLSPPDAEGGAWTETVLYSFNARRDGMHPQAPLIADAAGNLYGTTVEGGLGGGAVFRLSPPRRGSTAWTEKTLFRFTGGADGGGSSGQLLLGDDGALYGTAQFGGRFLRGVVFRLTPGATRSAPWTQTVIHDFAGGTDGGKPRSGLVPDGSGGFYGSASGGGLAGRGTVFQLQPASPDGEAWQLTTLHYFAGGNDGIGPFGELLLRDGKLYGVTQGSQLGPGTAYMIEP